jgi:hypothetical protein
LAGAGGLAPQVFSADFKSNHNWAATDAAEGYRVIRWKKLNLLLLHSGFAPGSAFLFSMALTGVNCLTRSAVILPFVRDVAPKDYGAEGQINRNIEIESRPNSGSQSETGDAVILDNALADGQPRLFP